MNSLKLFYKKEIKEIAETLRVSKPKSRKLQSLRAKGLSESEEGQTLSKDLAGVYISSLRVRVRYLYLAYALIRNKDPKKVEKNYPNHDSAYLDKIMNTMNKSFEDSQKEKEVSNV